LVARIRVPDGHPSVTITDGGDAITYTVKAGEIVADDQHAAAILGAVEGSALKQEAPATPAKSEAPTKEK
jgi:hypothetical protein